MTRPPRDRGSEAAAITAATDRLLSGTPIRSNSGKLTATELIIESGLARDKVYDHKTLVEQYQANVRARDHTPTAMQTLADECARVTTKLANVSADLAAERNRNRQLRLHIAELSLELDHTRTELDTLNQIPRLPRASTSSPADPREDTPPNVVGISPRHATRPTAEQRSSPTTAVLHSLELAVRK